MKLKETFILHDTGEEHIIVSADPGAYNGIVKLNQSAAFIVGLLREDTTKEEIIAKMLDKYDAEESVIAEDVDAIIRMLSKIGAIEHDDY